MGAFVRLESLQPIEYVLEFHARDAGAVRRSHGDTLSG